MRNGYADKSGTDVRVGDLGTVEGGLGAAFYKKESGAIPMVMNLGAVGYAQCDVTSDRGSAIADALRGVKDCVFASGPEFSIFLSRPRLTFLARYHPAFAARNRAQDRPSFQHCVGRKIAGQAAQPESSTHD